MSYAERLVIDREVKSDLIYDEHMVRYAFVERLAQDKRILDVASGSGYGSALLSKTAKSVIGIDLDKDAVEKARAMYGNEKLKFEVGDAGALKLNDKSVDLITSFETIEHLENVGAYLKELLRVSTDEAIVCISTPNKEIYKEKNPFHVKEYTKQEFVDLLKRYFSEVKIFEQKNALSSFIKADTKNEKIIVNDDNGKARYFIAICSNKEIGESFDSSAAINTLALERWENNPGWRLINFLYSILQKLKIFH